MRTFNELVAVLGGIVSLSLIAVVLVLAALITGALWFFWPSWWRAMARLRWPGRRGKKEKESNVRLITDEELDEVAESPEELPDVLPAVFLALADRLAGEGRYAEAVRERLRAMVRELVDRGVIIHRPGWTVTELAEAAGLARPGVRPPVTSATTIFSRIWYAKHQAHSDDDTQMRVLAEELAREMSRR